jgi:hypothetical protein
MRTVDEAEDGGVGADTESESEDGDGGEHRSVAAEILQTANDAVLR